MNGESVTKAAARQPRYLASLVLAEGERSNPRVHAVCSGDDVERFPRSIRQANADMVAFCSIASTVVPNRTWTAAGLVEDSLLEISAEEAHVTIPEQAFA